MGGRESEDKGVVEGFENTYKYYIGDSALTSKKETLYTEKGKKVMDINKNDELVNYRDGNKKSAVKVVNEAPDPYHHMFEYKDDKIKIFQKRGEAKISFDSESKQIEVKDNKDKSETLFKYAGKTICKARLSDNDKYHYLLLINDTNMINLLPLYFVTLVLLQRGEAE